MKRVLSKTARSLVLIPVTLVAVYLLVMNLPYREDSDRKVASSEAAGRARIESVLGGGGVTDVLAPWKRLFAGESIGVRGDPFTGRDFARGVLVSATLGAGALALAIGWALVYGVLRIFLRGRRSGLIMEIIPALVFGTPLFMLAVVAALAAFALGAEFSGSRLLAMIVMATTPGTFLGVVLSDAIRGEKQRQYYVTALAKGCTPFRAMTRHALPNALPALLDAVGPVAAALLAGSFVAENFFQIKGFGLIYLNAARTVDPGVVVVATTVFASLLIAVAAAVDLARLLLDPLSRKETAGNGG